jgi:hypothetical protein
VVFPPKVNIEGTEKFSPPENYVWKGPQQRELNYLSREGRSADRFQAEISRAIGITRTELGSDSVAVFEGGLGAVPI